MSRYHNEDKMVEVRVIGGAHHVFMPDGTKLPFVFSTTVEDPADGGATLTIKMACRLAPSVTSSGVEKDEKINH